MSSTSEIPRQDTDRWAERIKALADAVVGVPLSVADTHFLNYLARSDEATAAAVDLFGRLRRGAYPILESGEDADVAELAKARRAASDDG